MIPSWKDAPQWANCLAQNEDGTWYWWSGEPHLGPSRWLSDIAQFRAIAQFGLPNPNWRYMLQHR